MGKMRMVPIQTKIVTRMTTPTEPKKMKRMTMNQRKLLPRMPKMYNFTRLKMLCSLKIVLNEMRSTE